MKDIIILTFRVYVVSILWASLWVAKWVAKCLAKWVAAKLFVKIFVATPQLGCRAAAKLALCFLVFGVGMVSCSPFRPATWYQVSDITPPTLELARATSASQITLCFDEEVTAIDHSVQIDSVAVDGIELVECGIAINTTQDISAGVAYRVGVTVEDANANSLNIVTEVYGYNSSAPTIVINEFTTKGSKNHPDVVELYVVKGGNIGGITLFNGTATNWKSKKILPNLTLASGSYILVHLKPDGTDAEIDEITDSAVSGGKDSHPNAWDFWVQGGTGLSGNNGLVTLYLNPYGEILDAAPYSNRTSESDTKYRGFGSSSFMQSIDEIVALGAWHTAHERARPEDLIYSGYSTATRSINRSSSSHDSNNTTDWHTAPTSGYSFGQVNTDEAYVPKKK